MFPETSLGLTQRRVNLDNQPKKIFLLQSWEEKKQDTEHGK